MNSLYSKRQGIGPTILLIHGFCETHQIWDGFAEELATDFSVWSIDLPGFGRSELIEPLSIESVAQRVIEFAEHEKIGRCVVVGHSLGGYVALAMQQLKPDLFAGMVLFHSTVFADTEEKKTNRNKTIDFVKKFGVAPFADTFVPNLFYQKDHPAIPAVYSMALHTPVSTLIAYSQAMRDRPARDHLNGVDVLILAGQYDAIVNLSISQQMAALSDRARLKVLECSGHMGMYEDRLESLKAVRDFSFGLLV